MDFVLSPLDRLLLACLSLDRQNQSVLIEQAGPPNWQGIIQRAAELGVAPLLYGRLFLEPSGPQNPEEYAEELRQAYMASLKQNILLYQAFEEIGLAFERENIQAIPLKGLHLAENVYGNIGLRPMVDIDLLVRRKDLEHARQILEGAGYRAAAPFETQREAGAMHHLPPLEKAGQAPVELHWNLALPEAPFHIPVEHIWEEALPLTAAGNCLREMIPEHLLLHVCIHAAYLEAFASGLRPVCDIAWTVQTYREQLDWEKLGQEAQTWGAQRSLYLGLQVAHQILGAQVQPGFLERLRPADYSPELSEWAIAQILQPAEMGGKLAEVLMQASWAGRVRLGAQMLFPPRWEMRQSYPVQAHGAGWPLAYMKHLFLVFQRNRGTLTRLQRGEVAAADAKECRQRLNHLLDWQRGRYKLG